MVETSYYQTISKENNLRSSTNLANTKIDILSVLTNLHAQLEFSDCRDICYISGKVGGKIKIGNIWYQFILRQNNK